MFSINASEKTNNIVDNNIARETDNLRLPTSLLELCTRVIRGSPHVRVQLLDELLYTHTAAPPLVRCECNITNSAEKRQRCKSVLKLALNIEIESFGDSLRRFVFEIANFGLGIFSAVQALIVVENAPRRGAKYRAFLFGSRCFFHCLNTRTALSSICSASNVSEIIDRNNRSTSRGSHARQGSIGEVILRGTTSVKKCEVYVRSASR